jgi:thioredoxin-related protein
MDENKAGVAPFLKEEKWTTQVAFAEGLDRLIGVQAIPTLVIFDRTGRVVFRLEGLDFDSFVQTLEKRIREVLGRPVEAASH